MKFSHQRSRGFSLIELLFSMIIGSMILILAATMLSSSGDGYERIGGTVSVEREARMLITQLAADFASGSFNKEELITKSAATWPVDSLGFLSLQPAQAQSDAGRIGDLCAVNYYIKDLTLSGKTVRCLMRGFRESTDTFKAVKDDKVPSLFTAAAALDEPVAFGVLSFEARPKSRDASGNWTDWVKNNTIGPEVFEVKLILVRRSLVGKLTQSADWDGAGSSGNFLGQPSKADTNKNLQIYKATLRFGNYVNP